MMHSPIRLIALDLDGTLFGDDQAFSPRVIRAIAQAQERGIAVTLATGRGPVATRPFAERLHISVPLICYQGGLIVEPGGSVLHQIALDRELAAQVVNFAESRNWHVNLFQDGRLYVSEFRHPLSFYEAMLNPATQLVPDLHARLDHDPDKVLIVAEGNGDEILAELRARFDGQAQIVRSHELFIEAGPLGVDKGSGLAWLAEHLGVPQSQVMAVGDQDNDAPMVAWAGLGVAMGNASAECKAAANWIAPPFSEDGAAVAIERFVLIPPSPTLPPSKTGEGSVYSLPSEMEEG
jgi:Cof subfamily protein (haloacid dehalogenase superfamily)